MSYSSSVGNYFCFSFIVYENVLVVNFFFFNKCLKRDCSLEIKRFLVSCYCNIHESVHSKVMFHTAIIAVV